MIESVYLQIWTYNHILDMVLVYYLYYSVYIDSVWYLSEKCIYILKYVILY